MQIACRRKGTVSTSALAARRIACKRRGGVQLAVDVLSVAPRAVVPAGRECRDRRAPRAQSSREWHELYQLPKAVVASTP